MYSNPSRDFILFSFGKKVLSCNHLLVVLDKAQSKSLELLGLCRTYSARPIYVWSHSLYTRDRFIGGDIVKAFINRFRSVNRQAYLLCLAEQLNSLTYTVWLCIYAVNHILAFYILVIVWEIYSSWPLVLASHWLADFCKYQTEFVEINYYYKAAFSKCDSQQQQANQLLSLATKGQPLLRQSLFKRWIQRPFMCSQGRFQTTINRGLCKRM